MERDISRRFQGDNSTVLCHWEMFLGVCLYLIVQAKYMRELCILVVELVDFWVKKNRWNKEIKCSEETRQR